MSENQNPAPEAAIVQPSLHSSNEGGLWESFKGQAKRCKDCMEGNVSIKDMNWLEATLLTPVGLGRKIRAELHGFFNENPEAGTAANVAVIAASNVHPAVRIGLGVIKALDKVATFVGLDEDAIKGADANSLSKEEVEAQRKNRFQSMVSQVTGVFADLKDQGVLPSTSPKNTKNSSMQPG